MNDRYQTSLEAHPGFTFAALQDVATLYALSKPDVVVISSGLVDVWRLEAPWNGFDELLLIGDTISKYRGCVVWVNIMNGAGFPPPGVDPVATQRANGFNAALTYWATVYPNLRIVDWNATVLAEGVDRLLLPLNPHANQLGQSVLATMIDDAVPTC